MRYLKENLTSFSKMGSLCLAVDSPQLKVAGYLLAHKQSQKSALLSIQEHILPPFHSPVRCGKALSVL
jgi:hypothetical protein